MVCICRNDAWSNTAFFVVQQTYCMWRSFYSKYIEKNILCVDYGFAFSAEIYSEKSTYCSGGGCGTF